MTLLGDDFPDDMYSTLTNVTMPDETNVVLPPVSYLRKRNKWGNRPGYCRRKHVKYIPAFWVTFRIS